MFLFEYNHEWWGMWCDHCGTEKCACGAAPASSGEVYLSYTSVLKNWGVDTSRRDLYELGASFYLTIAKKMLGLPHDPDEIKNIADILAAGTAASCLGEARYEFACAMHEYIRRAKPEYAEKRLYKHSRLYKWLVQSGVGERPHANGAQRDSFVNTLHLGPKDAANLARRVLGAHLRFTGTSGGYGGVLWWEGAYLASQYYNGKMGPMVFADLMFNAMHNGGNLLNKAFEIPKKFFALLDFKRNASPEQLIEALGPSHDTHALQDTFVDHQRVKAADLWELMQEIIPTGQHGALYSNNVNNDSVYLPSIEAGYHMWAWLRELADDEFNQYHSQADKVNAKARFQSEWNISRLSRSVLHKVVRDRIENPYADFKNYMSQYITSELLATQSAFGVHPSTMEIKSLNKDYKRDKFYEKYRNQFLDRHEGCNFCFRDSGWHPAWPEYVDQAVEAEEVSGECDMGTEGCCHTDCGDCCCGEHNEGEHSEWCDNYSYCYIDEPGCTCQRNFCCHDYSYTNDHDEDCTNYEE